MKKSYKTLALCLTGIMAVSALSGCGTKKTADGKINISIGGWPDVYKRQSYHTVGTSI